MKSRARVIWFAVSPVAATVLLLGVSTCRAEDAHDEDTAAPEISIDESATDEGASRSRGPTAPVVERFNEPATQPRDEQGRLSPPPIFLTASQLFETKINEPPPAPPVREPALATATEPRTLDQIPTYAGSPPNASTGYIGSDLTSESAPVRATEGQKEAEAQSAKAEQEKKAANDTYVKIRSAIGGNVETDPVAGDARNAKPRRPQDRAPASTPPLAPQLSALQ